MSTRRRIFVFVAVPLLIVFAAVGYFAFKGAKPSSSVKTTPTVPTPKTKNSVSWSFNGNEWKPSGTAPACEDPLVLTLPTAIEKVTGVLYPGQFRGGDYKPHGGFRFDGLNNADVTVTIPLDAQLVEGSRYIQDGEVQHLFTFINDCGLAYRFDHLLTLSSTFQTYADQLPSPQVDDSRTTPFVPAIAVQKGMVVAEAVGFTANSNVTFDWGVYDLRAKNVASKNTVWAAAHADDQQFGAYGVCWLDLLSETDSTRLKALPISSAEGAISDYCS